MEKEKIGIVFTSKSEKTIKSEILTFLKDLNVEVMEIKNSEQDYQTIYKVGVGVHNQTIHRAIVIDDFGTLPFMILAKIPGLIVAQISDEHSAHMTSEHNGANVICLGTKLNSVWTLKRIITKFVQQPFAAGRHLVRTEMLAEMLKKERIN